MSTGCPCGSCVARPMLGTSWWKNLGFNEPTECAIALREQGFRWFTEWYQPRGVPEWYQEEEKE